MTGRATSNRVRRRGVALLVTGLIAAVVCMSIAGATGGAWFFGGMCLAWLMAVVVVAMIDAEKRL